MNKESDSDCELDLSWTRDDASDIATTAELDPVHVMKFPKLINAFFVYISKKNVILSVVKKQIPTIEKDEECCILKEKILKYIQQNKIISRKKNQTQNSHSLSQSNSEEKKNKTLKHKIVKYRMEELVLYIPEGEKIPKIISYLNDVKINATIEILHKLNSLYFLMKEQ